MAAFARSEDWPVWILFSARPLSMALVKRWGRAVLVLLAAAHAAELLLCLHTVAVSSLRVSRVRLTAGSGEARVGCAAAAREAEVRLLADGCPVLGASHRRAGAGRDGSGGVEFVLGREVGLSGWFVSPGCAAHGTWLEVSPAADAPWVPVTPPPWIRRWASGEAAGGREGLVDLRPSWRWMLQECCCRAGLALGYLVAAVLTAGGRGRRGAVSCAGTHVVCGCLSLAAAAAACFEAGGEPAIATAAASVVFGALYAWYAAAVWMERSLAEVALAASVLFAAVALLDRRAHFPNRSSSLAAAVGEHLPLVWAGVTVCGCVATLATRRAVRRWVSERLVAADRRAMDASWGCILARPASREALEKLVRWNVTIAARLLDPVDLWQGLPRPAEAATGAAKKAPAIGSLEQVYRQAAALDPVLRSVAQSLAQACGGSLPAPGSCWAGGVKPTERALEKLLRCYDCAVPRLLDCCRQVDEGAL